MKDPEYHVSNLAHLIVKKLLVVGGTWRRPFLVGFKTWGFLLWST